MESINYSNLGNKLNRRSIKTPSKVDYISLKDLIQRFEDASISYVDEKEIVNSYVSELEMILKLTTIEATIKEIYSLEATLQKVKELAPIDYEVPSFNEFWKSLSKTILLSLWESLENGEKTDEIVKGWYESLRISIESELYSIQENFL